MTENDAKELKVKLPVAYVLRLQQRKLVEGIFISTMVTQALDAYFAKKLGCEPPIVHAGRPSRADIQGTPDG